MFRVGQLTIIVSPGEATTMAGRRWKAAVADELDNLGIISKESGWMVLGGPANTYTHYIATPEEYGIQRYEGASTLYGQFTYVFCTFLVPFFFQPNLVISRWIRLLTVDCFDSNRSLEAYISLYKTYTPYLAATLPPTPLPTGTSPPINTNNSISLITGVVQDNPPLGKRFGSVLTDVTSSYQIGATVKAIFVGSNPRNNLRLEGTFTAVEKNNGGTWTRVRDDTDWNLVYQWKRTELLTGQSEVTITWTVESGTPAGQYRIRYYGDSKALFGGKITAFEGVSGVFNVM